MISFFFMKRIKIIIINEEMLENGAKSFKIPILFPWLHAKYSKHFLYHNHWWWIIKVNVIFNMIPKQIDQIQRLFTLMKWLIFNQWV